MHSNAVLNVKDFSMMHTVESAQPLTFFAEKMEKNEDSYSISYINGESLINVTQHGNALELESYGGMSEKQLVSEVKSRFGLDDSMKDIYEKIATDKFMRTAVCTYPGMRITKNDPWETTLCFIISQFNNVKRIRGITRALMNKYGEEFEVEGKIYHKIPTSEALLSASKDDLMACGTGFRYKYITGSSKMCASNVDLSKLDEMDYAAAKSVLMGMPGIGDKVADCILLMGYKKLNAFPIDTWVKRVMEHVYFGGKKHTIGELHEFADSRWNEYSGYAQQYLFWHGRSIGIG